MGPDLAGHHSLLLVVCLYISTWFVIITKLSATEPTLPPMNLILLFSANCEQNVMDIRKYLGKTTQKEQSDKSGGEESDTEESLCCADKSKTFMTYPVFNKLSAQQKKKCYKKKLSYKKVWEKVYPWVQCEDHEVGMFCTLCKKWQGHHQVQKVGGRQGKLLTGTMPDNY